MKKLFILLPIVLFLSGCSFETIDEINQQRIEQYKKCKDAGLNSYIGSNGGLFCSPRK